MAKPTPLSASSPAQALRDALGEAKAQLGSEADLQRLRGKLGELPPVTATGASGALHTSALGVKAVALTIGGVVIVAAALAYLPREPDAKAPVRAPAPPAATPIAEAPAPPEPAVVPVSEPPPVQVAPRAPKVMRSLAPAAQTQAPAAQTQAPAATPADAPKELALLMSAQDSLDASPQRALGLLDQHAQLYPDGSFALEREALAIDALRKLGRTSVAQARARVFIARFPNAPGSKRLRSWLDESAAPDHKTDSQPLPTR